MAERLDVLPRPAPGAVAGLVILLVVIAVFLAGASAALGLALSRGDGGAILQALVMLAVLGAAGWFALRSLRRMRDRRPALVIRPEGLTLPRHGRGDVPVRLRWAEIETIGLPGAETEIPRLHIGLTADASRARGAAVAHLADDTPHIGNRLRYWQGLGGLSESPERIRAALFTAAQQAGVAFVPGEAALPLRMLEGSASPYPRWVRAG